MLESVMLDWRYMRRRRFKVTCLMVLRSCRLVVSGLRLASFRAHPLWYRDICANRSRDLACRV